VRVHDLRHLQPVVSCVLLLVLGQVYGVVFKESMWCSTNCTFRVFEGYYLSPVVCDVFYFEYSFVNPVFRMQVGSVCVCVRVRMLLLFLKALSGETDCGSSPLNFKFQPCF